MRNRRLAVALLLVPVLALAATVTRSLRAPATATATLTVLDPTFSSSSVTGGYQDTSTTNIGTGSTYSVSAGTLTATDAANTSHTWSGGVCSGTGSTCTLTSGQSATVTFWPSGSHNWWVATGGSDANGGHAPTDAYATFHKALTTMAAGDALWIDDGTYSQDGGIGGYGGQYSAWDTTDCNVGHPLVGHPPCLCAPPDVPPCTTHWTGVPNEGKSGTDNTHRTRILGFRRHAVIVDGTGRAAGKKIALQLWKAAHVEVGNIVFQHSQTTGPVEVEQSSDIYLHDIGAAWPDPVNSGDNNRAGFYIGDVDGILVQNSWAWGFGERYPFVAHGSINVTLRENVARYDGSYDGQPRAGFSMYSLDSSIAENNVVIDFDSGTDNTSSDNHAPLFSTCSSALLAPSTSLGQGTTSFLGNIAVNTIGTTNGYLQVDTACSTGGTMTLVNNVLHGGASGSTVAGIWLEQDATNPHAAVISHNTIYNSRGRGLRFDDLPTWPTISFKDSLVDVASLDCEQDLHVSRTTADHNQFYSCTAGTTADTNLITTDPQLLYLLRVDQGGGKGTASDGGDRGATVVYRYVNGTLTGTPLWPFPNEDIIKADFCQGPDSGTLQTRGHNRTGWCASYASTAPTLTGYVWEQLGNPSPYGGGSLDGGVPDLAVPPDMTTIVDLTGADLIVPPDLVPPPDLYVPPDLTPPPTYAQAMASLGTQPTARWIMNEASGNLADSSGSRTATAAGTPLYHQSSIVTSDTYSIDSNASGYFSFASLALSGDFTIVLWYRAANTAGGASWFAHAATDDGFGKVAYYNGYVRLHDDSGTLMVADDGSSELANNTTYFIVFRRSGTAVTVYVNNVNKTNLGGTSSATLTLLYMMTAKGSLFAEQMAEAAIWQGMAISNGDVTTLYNAGK